MLKVQVQPGEALACRNKSIIGLSGSVKVANKTAVWQRLAGHNFITQNVSETYSEHINIDVIV